MGRYKSFFNEGMENNIIPNKTGITDLNIIQILALGVIHVYRTGRIKSFIEKLTSHDPRFFSIAQKKKETQEYIDKIDSTDGKVLWGFVLGELSAKGLVDKRGSLTSEGKQEVINLVKHFAKGGPSFI